MGQTASSVLMIRPARFGSNPETAPTNAFQSKLDLPPHEIQGRALAEFEVFVATLENAGVNVEAFDDTTDSPDAVFPNNWVSFHEDGAVVLYPMRDPSRRREVRPDVLERLERDHGFAITRVVDLRDREPLEGTGSLVLDHENRVAYACLSPRTHADTLREFGRELGYEIVAFGATDAGGQAIYHTNVVLTIGESFAVICSGAVREEDRHAVAQRLARTGREVIDISMEQMRAFGANVLQLQGTDGRHIVAASATAYDALTEDQRDRMDCPILAVALPTIETCGGGSARCMLAEIFLPLKAKG